MFWSPQLKLESFDHKTKHLNSFIILLIIRFSV